MKYLLILVASVSILCSHAALAADPVTHECKQPVIPNTQASDVVRNLFEKRSKVYKACIQKFVDDQSAIAKSATDITTANLAHDAAQKAIEEYNAFMNELNERNENAHPDEDGNKGAIGN